MNFTTGKYFLDTNILIYAFSEDEDEKRRKSHEIILAGDGELELVISSQVLTEVGRALLQKYQVPVREVLEILQDLNRFEVVALEWPIIKRGIELFELYKTSYWDSMIIAAAEHVNCDGLFIEDLPGNQPLIGKLNIINPYNKGGANE